MSPAPLAPLAPALLLVVAAGTAIAVPASPPEAAARPNIVLVMTDDQGWDQVGYNGHPVLRTPNLDRMAASGLRFDRFYAAHPLCSPTRASVLTGRHPSRYRCDSWGHDLPLSEVTLAEILAAEGYATAHFGKWHLGGLAYTPGGSGRGRAARPDQPPPHPGRQGFAHWLSHGNWFDLDPEHLVENGRPVGRLRGEPSAILVREAVRFITANAGRRPFLVVLWFPAPHVPWEAAEEDLVAYASAGERAGLYAEISAMDRALGDLRRALDELGLRRDTLLWFFSDNGPAVEANGLLRGCKGSLNEGGIRVPAVLEWPRRLPSPRRTSIPASTCDVLPTILDELDLAPHPAPPRPDGISLRLLLDGRLPRRPRPIPFELRDPGSGEVVAAAVIDNRHKLIRARGSDRLQLFDVEADPGERHDLAGAHPELVRRLAASLGAWQAAVERERAGAPPAPPPRGPVSAPPG